MDKSQPSTNAVSASNLFRLGTLLGEDAYLIQARETVNAFEAEILQYPWLFVSLLTGVVAARLGVKRVELRKADEEGLRRWYTTPRAQAAVLILLGDDDKAPQETTTTAEGQGLSRPAEGALEEKVKGLAIGGSART